MLDNEIGGAVIRVAPFLALIAVIGFRVRQGRILASDIAIRSPHSWRAVFAWLLGFLLLAFGVEWIVWQAGLLELGGFKHDGVSALIRIVGMVALAPIAEEFLFRGILLNWLEKRTGKFFLAAALQAIAFVAVHNFTYSGSALSIIAVVQSFIDAMLFAFARRQTGSILTPILMHASGNLIAVAEMLA